MRTSRENATSLITVDPNVVRCPSEHDLQTLVIDVRVATMRCHVYDEKNVIRKFRKMNFVAICSALVKCCNGNELAV